MKTAKNPQNRAVLAQNQPRRFEIKAAAQGKTRIADVWLYADIGSSMWGGESVGAKQFADELGAVGEVDEIRVYINSGGGDVFDGLAIYTILKRNKARKTVYVDGLAASIASVIAMAGDTITMSANAFMMIHDPWTMAGGNASDLREVADQLDKVGSELADTYTRRTKMARGKVSELMKAETWMTADEAVKLGFADSKTDDQAMAASVDIKRFKNAPRALLTSPGSAGNNTPSLRDRIAAADRDLKAMRNPVRNEGAPGSPDLPPQTAPDNSPEIVKPAPDEETGSVDMGPEDLAYDACNDAMEEAHEMVATYAGTAGMGDCVKAALAVVDACQATASLLCRDSDHAGDMAKVCTSAMNAAMTECAKFINMPACADLTNACKTAMDALSKLS